MRAWLAACALTVSACATEVASEPAVPTVGSTEEYFERSVRCAEVGPRIELRLVALFDILGMIDDETHIFVGLVIDRAAADGTRRIFGGWIDAGSLINHDESFDPLSSTLEYTRAVGTDPLIERATYAQTNIWFSSSGVTAFRGHVQMAIAGGRCRGHVYVERVFEGMPNSQLRFPFDTELAR